jgi:hypothetical protein
MSRVVPLVIWGMAAAASGFMLPCAHVGRYSTLISGPAKRSFSAPLVHRHLARRRASVRAVQASAAVCAPVLSHTPPLSCPARCAQPLRHTHSSLSCPRPRIHQREMAEKAINRDAMQTLEQQGFVVIDGAISGQDAAKALKGCEMMQRSYLCVYARERQRGD